MKQIAAYALLLVMLVSCISVPGGRSATARNVWRLSTSDLIGSAFPVSCEKNDDGLWVVLFLTAKHLTDAKNVTYLSADLDGSHPIAGGVVLSQHPTQDASLVLFVTPSYIKPVILDDRRAVFCEEVWAAGYPAAIHLVVTSGLVGGRCNQASSSIYLGNSGGAVIDSGGRVLGISVSRLMDGTRVVDHVMYFVPITDLADWLHFYGINT